MRQVESHIKRNCSVDHLLAIGMDQLHKIQGFDGAQTNGAQRLQRIAFKARHIATKYAPVIGLIWADTSAEPRQDDKGNEVGQWIGQHQMDGSKTGIPGEADTIIGIGQTTRPSDKMLRFINIPKNKSLACKDESKRHHRFVMRLDVPRSRLTDVSSGGTV